ncbi:MAG: MFS transporter [Gammaproteobacteria bacterium]|nr:MFS transporter [Gammaproteobacteria bacterium]
MGSDLVAKKHYETAPEDRILFAHKLIYGLGAFVNNILAAGIGGMSVILILALGMNPALVGLLGSLPRLTDAITDPLMGYISDNTRSRWGRRRPYIFCGAIFSGIIFAILWQLPVGQSETYYFWYFLIGSFIFYLAYTVFATPWVALGYELTPDYHERTRLMGVQNFIGTWAWIVAPWFLPFMQLSYFDDVLEGASILAILLGVFAIVIGVLPAIFLIERFSHPELTEEELAEKAQKKPFMEVVGKNMKEFGKGFAATLKVKPFLLLCVATFLVFNGFMLISQFQLFVVIYYITGGDTVSGAEINAAAGSVGAVATFAVIVLVTWLSTKTGKRKAFFWAIGVSIFGYALKWFCYDPSNPWLVLLPAPLIAFGMGSLFTIMGSMVADVCDYDELQTGERREGMFGSIFWWVVKLGMALALALSGILLNITGFDVELGANQTESTILLMRLFDVMIPIVTSAIAIWAIYYFPITEEKAHQIRVELEQRRGAPEGDPA